MSDYDDGQLAAMIIHMRKTNDAQADRIDELETALRKILVRTDYRRGPIYDVAREALDDS